MSEKTMKVRLRKGMPKHRTPFGVARTPEDELTVPIQSGEDLINSKRFEAVTGTAKKKDEPTASPQKG